ncbi:MAG: S53 family peptidase [Candidatus Eremiobacteraeota bacterium]|nr:S53 family peptidase [Candidatus Eremiobacteraeota bacterium]
MTLHRMLLALVAASLLAACGSAPVPAVVPAARANLARMHGHRQPKGLLAGERSLGNGQALPIDARAIPINFTGNPQTALVCGVLAGASCTAIRRLDVVPALGLVADLIAGYQPSDLRMAYNLPATGGAGQTIGIVIAYDNPHAAADLAIYRSTFGLPPCTTSSGCLRFVNGSAPATALPAPNEAWGQELSIDLDVASAICPACKLLVSEAPSAGMDDLTRAMQTAVAQGATVVSNSYTAPETAALAAGDAKWNHPGVPIVAGAGDAGYGVGWPAASSHVVAVGGTTLLPVLGGLAVLESAWSQTGAGCSRYVAKPVWQHDTLCRMRTVSDIAAVADPVPGVSVYDTYFADPSNAGWNVYGGTSVATPIVAGVFALAGSGASTVGASGLYAARGSFNDVILGADGLCLTYLCTAGLGYDGPTGLGTPNGIRGF